MGGRIVYAPSNSDDTSDANLIDATGFYLAIANTWGGGWHYILHLQYPSNNALQFSSPVNDTTYLFRKKVDGVWQPWECINPPMKLGWEYRTTERYLGKPVYCKVVDCGTVPAVGASKTLMVAPNASIFSVSAYSPERGLGIPFLDANGVKLEINQSGNILIFRNYSEKQSDTNALATVKYTKTTD